MDEELRDIRQRVQELEGRLNQLLVDLHLGKPVMSEGEFRSRLYFTGRPTDQPD